MREIDQVIADRPGKLQPPVTGDDRRDALILPSRAQRQQDRFQPFAVDERCGVELPVDALLRMARVALPVETKQKPQSAGAVTGQVRQLVKPLHFVELAVIDLLRV